MGPQETTEDEANQAKSEIADGQKSSQKGSTKVEKNRAIGPPLTVDSDISQQSLQLDRKRRQKMLVKQL